jgi:hypothetical protein
MSATPPPSVRTLAFGDLDHAIWGAAWICENGDEWRLDDGEKELTVAPLGEPIATHDAENRIEGHYQLCRVTRRLDGGERAVDCLGVQTWFPSTVELERFESIRAVSTWFEPDEALVVTAFRARKAKGHDGDMITAAVFGPDGAKPVEDPRLSTTYEAGGWPVRAGLELWLGVEKPEEQHQLSRRASGEATGQRTEGSAGGLEIRAEPFRWHSRGRDGAGMYILAQRR